MKGRSSGEDHAILAGDEEVECAGSAPSGLPRIIGESPAMRRVLQDAGRIATSNASVLLLGDTGTGKELIARAIHAMSDRREHPFLAVNLAAIPDTLLESELFGHERDAFTGARAARVGRLEAACGGTLFLDEVGDLRPDIQLKLLRVLEYQTFERLGSTEPRRADFRLICATHRDLEERVATGSLREDFYYRINVVRIELPPLRERPEDLGPLIEHFLGHYCERHGVRGVSLTARATEALCRHPWPGNVRELQHVIERAVAMTPPGTLIDEDRLWLRPPRASNCSELRELGDDDRGMREILADVEYRLLVEALEACQGNRVAAARKLKIPRQTLQHRLKKYGL